MKSKLRSRILAKMFFVIFLVIIFTFFGYLFYVEKIGIILLGLILRFLIVLVNLLIMFFSIGTKDEKWIYLYWGGIFLIIFFSVGALDFSTLFLCKDCGFFSYFQFFWFLGLFSYMIFLGGKK